VARYLKLIRRRDTGSLTADGVLPNGQRVRRSLKTADPAIAVERLNLLEQELLNSPADPAAVEQILPPVARYLRLTRRRDTGALTASGVLPNGQRVRRSLKTADPAIAAERLNLLEQELLNSPAGPAASAAVEMAKAFLRRDERGDPAALAASLETAAALLQAAADYLHLVAETRRL
jgi:hypothetical protein